LNDMGRIDPMYQFSLDAYINLFNLSIEKSKSSLKLEERIVNLNDYHTYAVYKYACRGLFEMHKLLFSFQMCAKILEVAGTVSKCLEYQKRQIHSGSKIFFVMNLQRMLIVRSLRPDRVLFCATTFIVNYLGPRFVEPPVLDMRAVSRLEILHSLLVVDESTCTTPLVFVLSPGVDPTGALLQLAETTGMSKLFHALSLGQGQAPIAKKMIEEGVKKGHWVFLANCHLSLSWMPELDKLVEQLEVQKPHADFRLWLSSSPHPDFPINILQAGIKMTTEPPKVARRALRENTGTIRACHVCAPLKLLFSLCFFHSILLERKKFLQLGWNIIYGFNNSDFEVSENLLSLYLNEYEQIPWDALKYLIAEVNYGGHVTDDWDRRLLTTYINDYFCEAAVTELSTLATYYIPHDGPLSSYKDFINMLPTHEHPDLFGQHPNADIASQIAETRSLFDTLLSLQPQVTSASAAGAGPSREDKVRPSPPASWDKSEPNVLPKTSSLVELEKGIKGLVVMSSSLEETFNCMYDARVPPLWEKAYPSLKPLAAWTRDLCQRVLQFSRWAEQAQPPNLFWLSGFTFPNGFLTAVLQSAARHHLAVFINQCQTGCLSNLQDGVYVRGLYLEGAAWDKKATCLVEAEPMQMVCPIPAINFKPVENRKKMAKSEGVFVPTCPSFVIAVELKSGNVNPDHWIKRGAALLMSLDS
uniref:Uncharacterized protein n=1 Tax=Hippocampus comes TaxID=109280 RepID=A0A3Q2Z5C8_HIPCM